MALPEVTAKLDADVSGFVSAWQKAAAAATAAAAQIKAAMASVGDGVDAKAIARTGEEIKKVGDVSRKAAGDIRSLSDGGEAFERVGQSARSASDGVRQFGGASNQARDALGRFTKAGEEAGKSLGGGGGGLGGGLQRSRAYMAAFGAAIAVLIGILPAVAAAVLALGAAFQGLGVAAGVIIGGWRGIEQAGERLKASMGGLQKQLESVFRSQLSGEFQKLGQAISQMDSPLKGIARSISDVVKAFTGWVRSAEGMRQIEQMLGGVDNLIKSLAPGAKALAQAFTEFGAAAAPSMDDIGKALSSVFESLKRVIDKGKETGQLEKAFQAGAKAIEAFGEVLAGIVDILIEVAGSAGEPAADALKKLGQAMQDAAPYIAIFVKALAQMVEIAATVIRWLAAIAKALEPMFRAYDKATDSITEFLEALDPARLEEFGKKVEEFAKKIPEEIKKGIDKAIEAVKKWWEDTKKAIKEGVQKAVEDIKKWADETRKNIEKLAQEAQKAVKKWWEDTKKAVKDGVNKAVEEIKKWAKDLAKDLKQGVDDFVSEVEKWWDETVQAIQDGVQEAVDEVKQLPERALEELKGSLGDFSSVGEDMGKGIADGLKSAGGTIAEAAMQAAREALDAAKSILGIRSPSTVMRDEIGAMMSAGIAQGILSNTGLINDAMRRAGLGALASGKGALGAAAVAGRGGALTIQIAPGADTAVSTMIGRLAQQGKLKITANAVVGGRAR